MIKGSIGKRFNYFMTVFFRGICFIATLIAYIVVKITVKPAIPWLNILLLCLAIGGLLSAVFNLVLCGMTATGYKEKRWLEYVCLIFTCVSGGLIGTTFTSVAFATKIPAEEIENERLVTIKK